MAKLPIKYTDPHDLSPGVTLEVLGEVESFLRIISYSNGIVFDGAINPMLIAKAMLHVLTNDAKMNKLFSIVAGMTALPQGHIRESLLEQLIIKAFPCNCEECQRAGGPITGHFSQN